MSLISVHQLTASQPTKTLFTNATFGIEASDKVAIIGTNGSGKTTLLNLLAKANTTPHEAISIRNGLRITHLPQSVPFDPKHSIQEHLFKSGTPAAKAFVAYNNCLSAYNDNPSKDNETQLTKAMEQMDHANAWDYENRVSSILRELNIHDLSQAMRDLSGGMLKKIGLAQAFFEDSDLLILDEPTNHLDIATIEWLEQTLKRQQSALLMVTHDRYFLDKICTKILEIDQEKLYAYKGNYQTYLEQREQRYLDLEKHDQHIQTVLRVELAWLRRGPKARSTKQKARKDRAHALMAHQSQAPQEQLDLNVAHRRLGKKILELHEVSKSFGDKQVVQPFSYTFKQGERIGILGPNGAGKTTLLKLITETLTPDSGHVDTGVNTVFGHFDQHSQNFDDQMTIYEHMNQLGSQISTHDGSTLSVSKLLERFLFPSSMLKSPIGKLSGGERRRLHLVCLLLQNPNFLLFDEPTNDLDTQTLSVLEDFLLSFKGCVIVISHDRYFMDRVVDKLLIFSEKSAIEPFVGNYSDYARERDDIQATPKKSAPTAPSAQPIAKTAPVRKKLSNSEREEFKRLEKEIEAIETEQQTLTNTLSDGSANAETMAATGKRLNEISKALETHYTRWEELAEKA